MTVIAAALSPMGDPASCAMGSDSALNNGGPLYDCGSKVHRVAPWLLVGLTGSHVLSEFAASAEIDDKGGSEYEQIARWWRAIRDGCRQVEHLSPSTSEESSALMPGHGLAVTAVQIFILGSDGAAAPIRNRFAAVGCGGEVALGAMHAMWAMGERYPGDVVQYGLDAACDMLNDCCKPSHVAQLPDD